MRILLDTNTVIPAEPTSEADVTENTRLVSLLLQEIQAGSHKVFVHPNIARDILGDSDEGRRVSRTILLKKYATLPSPPAVPQRLREIVGAPEPGSHNEVDDELLAAAFCDAVDFLVTEDIGIHKKARKAGINHKVLAIDEMLRLLRALGAGVPATLPPVTVTTCDQLNVSDPIFQSLRIDYDGFQAWLDGCKEEKRRAYVIMDGERYAAIGILKHESTGEHEFHGLVLKICTFKIGFDWIQYGYSELLLGGILNYAFEKGYDIAYLTALPKYGPLLNLLSLFGFSDSGGRTHLGELVYFKPLVYSAEDYKNMSCLEFQIRYGPRHVKVEGASGYVIPIQPKYHRTLFPDSQDQGNLFPGTHPSGNAIRKAYLCKSPLTKIEPGAVLLFYRSEDLQSVQCIGVAESSRRLGTTEEILRFVGSRSVYSVKDIQKWTEHGEVLAVLFRYARLLATPFSLQKLQEVGVLSKAPQSIVRIDEKGMQWLQKSLQQLP